MFNADVISMTRSQDPRLSQSDPLKIAWEVLGYNWIDTSDKNNINECGRCQIVAPLTLFKEIISNNFTGWGAINPSALGLCQSCTWGYRESQLRTRSVIVSSDGDALFATPDYLRTLLSQSLSPSIAISIPYAGKKHLLPSAEWGMVMSDDGPLSWRSTEAELITILIKLRNFGVYESEFLEPAPPYRVVAALSFDTDHMIGLLDLWEQLRYWQNGPHIKIAIRATRPNFTPNSSEEIVIQAEEGE